MFVILVVSQLVQGASDCNHDFWDLINRVLIIIAESPFISPKEVVTRTCA